MNAFEALAPGQVVVFLTTEQRFLQIIGSGTWARSARPIMMPIRARAPPSAPKHTTYKKLETKSSCSQNITKDTTLSH